MQKQENISINNRSKEIFCISSICEDKNHILFWDFDNIEQHFVLRSLSQIQSKNNLGDIYLVRSLNGFNAFCLDKFFLNHAYNILFYTRWNDFNHIRIGFRSDSWALRLSPDKKLFMMLIPTCDYQEREQSNAHFQFFKKFFGFKGLRIIHPDMYNDVQFESYKQNRC